MSTEKTILSQNHLFNEFFYGVRELDDSQFTPVNKSVGEILTPDEDYIYYLVEGSVAQYYHTQHEYSVTNPYRMHYFDLIGVYEMYYPSQIKIVYKAVTDCMLFAMSKSFFMELMKNNREFHQRVLINLINRQSFIAQHYKSLISITVEERVKKFIGFTIDTRYFEEHETFTISDSHQIMADSLGCNIRSVHRALKTLKRKNLIDIVGGKVTISKIQHQKCTVLA